MSINSVTISGNLTADAELRNTGNTDVVSFSVAVNESYKDKETGEWKDRPNFFNCTRFVSNGTKLQAMLTKGSKIAIHGKLRQEKWQDKNGETRYGVKIIVDDIEFMSSRQGTTEVAPSTAAPAAAPAMAYAAPAMVDGYYAAPAPAVAPMAAAPTLYDEDIPF